MAALRLATGEGHFKHLFLTTMRLRVNCFIASVQAISAGNYWVVVELPRKAVPGIWYCTGGVLFPRFSF